MYNQPPKSPNPPSPPYQAYYYPQVGLEEKVFGMTHLKRFQLLLGRGSPPDLSQKTAHKDSKSVSNHLKDPIRGSRFKILVCSEAR